MDACEAWHAIRAMLLVHSASQSGEVFNTMYDIVVFTFTSACVEKILAARHRFGNRRQAHDADAGHDDVNP